MPYRTYKVEGERDRRIFMAGLSFIDMMGFKTLHEFATYTTLIVGDLDTDKMLFFSNTIDRDEKNALPGNTDTLSAYFGNTIEAYVAPDHQQRAHAFFDAMRLREGFERAKVTEAIEYPCELEDGVMWIRACYYLEQDEGNGHLIFTGILINVTSLHNEQ